MGFYGRYDLSLNIELESLRIWIQQKTGLAVYERDLAGDRMVKVLGMNTGQIVIHPVEPLTVPKPISPYLEIAFDPVLVPPEACLTLYLTFPVDIGVFIDRGGGIEVLDTFSFNRAKYSLYGTPKSGVITKWFKSQISLDLPATDPLREGILQLTIHNTTKEFREVSRAVFDGQAMVLYYHDIVAMQAEMDLTSSVVAETSVVDAPLQSGMERSIELLKARRFMVVDVRKIRGIGGVEGKTFLMEWGYS